MNFYCCIDFLWIYLLSYYIIYIILTKINTYLQLLLLVEFIWIIFYVLCVLLSLSFDDIASLGIIFFLLIFSAVELSIGFMLITVQYYMYNNIQFKTKYNSSLTKIKNYYNWYNINK